MYKRKKLNLSIKRELQVWFLVRVLGVVILSSLVAAAVLYVYARYETTATFYSAHISIRRVSDLLLPVVLTGSGVSLVAGMFLALFLPQKIAGPIFRIEQDLKKVRAGHFTYRIHLRKKDILQDLATGVNSTIGNFRDHIHTLKEDNGCFEKLVKEEKYKELAEALEKQKKYLAELQT